jgi:hypothetical protein
MHYMHGVEVGQDKSRLCSNNSGDVAKVGHCIAIDDCVLQCPYP